jgi:hypothetical protein
VRVQLAAKASDSKALVAWGGAGRFGGYHGATCMYPQAAGAGCWLPGEAARPKQNLATTGTTECLPVPRTSKGGAGSHARRNKSGAGSQDALYSAISPVPLLQCSRERTRFPGSAPLGQVPLLGGPSGLASRAPSWGLRYPAPVRHIAHHSP